MAENTVLTFTREFETHMRPTEHVKATAAMFGIGIDRAIKVTLYRDLPVRLGRGRIVLLTGDSGAGKTTLLRDVRSRVSPQRKESPFVEASFEHEAPDEPLVDQFQPWGIKDTCELLNYVGISEAFVYLRTPRELSDGQRYRFNLARAIFQARAGPTGICPVIFADEFLALLDRETARAVAAQVRRVASSFGICFVVATTHQDIVEDLQPNTTITMRLALPPELDHRPIFQEPPCPAPPPPTPSSSPSPTP